MRPLLFCVTYLKLQKIALQNVIWSKVSLNLANYCHPLYPWESARVGGVPDGMELHLSPPPPCRSCCWLIWPCDSAGFYTQTLSTCVVGHMSCPLTVNNGMAGGYLPEPEPEIYPVWVVTSDLNLLYIIGTHYMWTWHPWPAFDIVNIYYFLHST